MGLRGKGTGGLYRPWYRDRKGQKRQSPVWCFRIRLGRGKRVAVSTGETDERKAELWRVQRLAALGRGDRSALTAGRLYVEELMDMVRRDYKITGKRSLRTVKIRIEAVLAYFGGQRAIDITSDQLVAYVDQRQEQRYANGTIVYELSVLRRGYNLAIKAGRLAYKPAFPSLRCRKRTGFFEAPAFESIRRHLDPDVEPVMAYAYRTGWRCVSELLTRQWQHVDLGADGGVRLEVGEGKTGKGRWYPLTPELRTILETQRDRVTALEQVLGRVIPWVFPRSAGRAKGRRIGALTFYRLWTEACEAAGYRRVKVLGPRGIQRRNVKIPHDTRRTHVRTLERTGVSRSVGMELVGHSARMYDYYAITSERDLREGALRAAAAPQPVATTADVVPIASGKKTS